MYAISAEAAGVGAATYSLCIQRVEVRF